MIGNYKIKIECNIGKFALQSLMNKLEDFEELYEIHIRKIKRNLYKLTFETNRKSLNYYSDIIKNLLK